MKNSVRKKRKRIINNNLLKDIDGIRYVKVQPTLVKSISK